MPKRLHHFFERALFVTLTRGSLLKMAGAAVVFPALGETGTRLVASSTELLTVPNRLTVAAPKLSLSRPTIRLSSPAPIVKKLTHPPLRPDGSPVPLTLQSVTPQRGGGGRCPGTSCLGNPVHTKVSNADGYSYVKTSYQEAYSSGTFTNSVRWTQPININPWEVTYESSIASALITGINLAVLQAEQQYLWIENIEFVISRTTLTSDGGIGINIYDGYYNPNSYAYIYLPPGNQIAQCLAWTLILTAATVAVLAAGAIVTEIACVNPAAPFTCAFAVGLAATLGAIALDPITKAAKAACNVT
jgi:hypothetical protein